jgi:hypothetical protein
MIKFFQWERGDRFWSWIRKNTDVSSNMCVVIFLDGVKLELLESLFKTMEMSILRYLTVGISRVKAMRYRKLFGKKFSKTMT